MVVGLVQKVQLAHLDQRVLKVTPVHQVQKVILAKKDLHQSLLQKLTGALTVMRLNLVHLAHLVQKDILDWKENVVSQDGLLNKVCLVELVQLVRPVQRDLKVHVDREVDQAASSPEMLLLVHQAHLVQKEDPVHVEIVESKERREILVQLDLVVNKDKKVLQDGLVHLVSQDHLELAETKDLAITVPSQDLLQDTSLKYHMITIVISLLSSILSMPLR